MRKYLILMSAAGALIAGSVAVQAQPYPSMMGGYGAGRMMEGTYGSGWMMGNANGPGWMMRGGSGPSIMEPYGNQGNLNLSIDDVRTFMQRMVQNPNLKVGDVKEKDTDTIIAEIVTKDKDALVQRFVVNRHSGFFQPEQ